MEILGYVEYQGDIYPFTDREDQGYLLLIDGEANWIGAKQCKETEIDKILTPKNEFEKALVNVCAELSELLIKKNRDYGDSFSKLYDEYGDFSTEHRLTDKLNRFKTLNKQKNLVGDENKDDTLIDIAGYACLTLAKKTMNKLSTPK